MKSLESFIKEASINEAAKSEAKKWLKNDTHLVPRSPKSYNDISDWFLAYYATNAYSAVDTIITLANAVKENAVFLDQCIKQFPDDEEVKEYKDNLMKLHKLIMDNFKK